MLILNYDMQKKFPTVQGKQIGFSQDNVILFLQKLKSDYNGLFY